MLTRASLRYYAATNALVVLGVAVAVAVLAGALLVGESVRESLKQIALGRLGNTDVVVSSPTFFRTALADDIARNQEPGTGNRVAPVIVAAGAVSNDDSKRSAGRVMVYGVDERFFNFHSRHPAPSLTGRKAQISEALAAELGAKAGDSITLRIAKPTDIPLSSLQGRREVTGQRSRLTIDRVLNRSTFGEFSLAPAQGPVLALYVPLDQLQRDLNIGDRVNTLLLKQPEEAGDPVYELVAPAAQLDDYGLRLRRAPNGNTIVESRAGVLTDALAEGVRAVASDAGLRSEPVLTYVANSIRAGDREIPYSVVSAIELQVETGDTALPPIWLNQWAADDLHAKTGDEVTLEYFLWSDANGLTASSTKFTCAGVLPMAGIGGDATLTPDYPGISDAADITAWDPPFPVDLNRVRKKDEDYWDQYRAAPKAIIRVNDAQRLWGSRYGRVSSLRLSGDHTDRRAGDRSWRRRFHVAQCPGRRHHRRARHHGLR